MRKSGSKDLSVTTGEGSGLSEHCRPLPPDYFRIRDFEYAQPLYDLAFLLEVDALAKGAEVPKYRTFSLWRAGYSLDGYGTTIDRWLDGTTEGHLDYAPSSRIREYLVGIRKTGTIPELRAADGKQLYEIRKHTDWITAIEFSPDGKLLATGDRSGGIFLWDSARGGNAGSLAEHKDSITSLSWRGDSRVLASGSEDGQIIIWNVADGFPAATIPKAHTPKAAPNTYGVIPGGVLGLQFTADGRLVSVGRDSMLKLWSGSGAAQSSSPAWSALLTKAAASFDGRFMIAGDYLGRLLIWDGRQFAEIRAAGAHIGTARP